MPWRYIRVEARVFIFEVSPGPSGSGCIWPVRYCSVLIAECPERIHLWAAVWDNGNRPLLTDRLVRKEYSDNRNR